MSSFFEASFYLIFLFTYPCFDYIIIIICNEFSLASLKFMSWGSVLRLRSENVFIFYEAILISFYYFHSLGLY